VLKIKGLEEFCLTGFYAGYISVNAQVFGKDVPHLDVPHLIS
jgi:hypothetical protein